jgi:hypothetical protein
MRRPGIADAVQTLFDDGGQVRRHFAPYEEHLKRFGRLFVDDKKNGRASKALTEKLFLIVSRSAGAVAAERARRLLVDVDLQQLYA